MGYKPAMGVEKAALTTAWSALTYVTLWPKLGDS